MFELASTKYKIRCVLGRKCSVISLKKTQKNGKERGKKYDLVYCTF